MRATLNQEKRLNQVWSLFDKLYLLYQGIEPPHAHVNIINYAEYLLES